MKRDASPLCTGNGVRVHQGNKKSNGGRVHHGMARFASFWGCGVHVRVMLYIKSISPSYYSRL